MLPKICFAFFCVLAIRSLVLMIAERKPGFLRLFDFILAALFSGIAVLLFLVLRARIMDSILWTAVIFAALLLVVLLLLNLRLRRPYLPRPGLMGLKVIVVLIVVSLSLIALMMSGFQYLTDDRPVMKIVIPGNQSSEEIEWQPPNGLQRTEEIPTYEVQFQTPEGKPLTQIFVYGDQVGIKAKVIRFNPMMNVIGIHNVCRIDYVHNGYETAERFNRYPHHAWEISTGHPWVEPFQEPFWNYWEEIFRGTGNSAIKSASLESSYFPLVTKDGLPYRGSYFLTVTPGGLSSVPLP